MSRDAKIAPTAHLPMVAANHAALERAPGSIRGAPTVMRGAVRLVTRGRGLREDFASAAAIRTLLADAGLSSAAPIEPPPPHLAHLRIPVRVWRAGRSEIG